MDDKKRNLREQFEEIAEFIREVGMQALVLTEEVGAPADTLLIGMSGEVEEGHYVVCNHMEEQEDEGLAECFQLYYEVPQYTDGLEPLDILQAVNAMNSVCRIGHFVWNRKAEQGQIHLRYMLLCEEIPDPDLLLESVQSMLDYALDMEELLAALSTGASLDTVLTEAGFPMEV